VGALTNREVGNYCSRHFVSAFQKVATFQLNGLQKQGGNVASYFCTPDGQVLHAVAGPVDSRTFLREARWANDTYQLALLENQKTLDQLRAFFRKAHLERLQEEQHTRIAADRLPAPGTLNAKSLGLLLDQNQHAGLSNQGKVHLLLAVAPLPRLDQVYQVVFEKILNEKVTTNPVGGG
jgi:hypothetical protein